MRSVEVIILQLLEKEQLSSNYLYEEIVCHERGALNTIFVDIDL